MFTYERLAQILLANGVNSPAELEKVLRYVLVLRDRPLPLDCPAGGGGSNQDGAGDPGGALVPDFVGQRYKDTNTGNIWIANSTTPGDWTLEVQNMQIKWTPTNVNLGAKPLYAISTQSVPISLVVDLITSEGGFQLSTANNLTAFSAPNLTSIGGAAWATLVFSTCPNLVSISAPQLVSVQDDLTIFTNASLTTVDLRSLVTTSAASSVFQVSVNPLLTSLNLDSLATVNSDFDTYGTGLSVLSLPSLTTVTGDWNSSGNASLTTVSIPNFLPTNGKTVSFVACNLNAASVNHILARAVANAGYVSGGIYLNQPNNAAPTGQGIIDKATLNARHAGLAVTN